MSDGFAQIQIAPNPAMVDEVVAIRVVGLPPGAHVLLHAYTEDDAGLAWESHALFEADAGGRIDLAAQAPAGGTYSGVDPMGMFWSMAPSPPATPAAEATNHPAAVRPFTKNEPTPNLVLLGAEIDGTVIASAEFERQFLAPGVLLRDVRDDGLVARLFVPPGPGPHRVVMVLGGTSGGLDTDKAAVLASHGFATLALAYFRAPWLREQPSLDATRLGVLGISKGSELALLLGATFPAIRAVVAYAPSAVVWAAGGRDKLTGEIHSSWTHAGRRVPFVPFRLRKFMLRSMPRYFLKKPISFSPLFTSALEDREAVERAAIPAEKTNGAILLISGDEDSLWPSSRMAQRVMDRLAAHRFAHPFRHLRYADAGHALRYPHLPTTLRQAHQPAMNFAAAFGGTAAGDARAQADAWREAIAFLDAHL
jgi:dienelactone hydrolase